MEQKEQKKPQQCCTFRALSVNLARAESMPAGEESTPARAESMPTRAQSTQGTRGNLTSYLASYRAAKLPPLPKTSQGFLQVIRDFLPLPIIRPILAKLQGTATVLFLFFYLLVPHLTHLGNLYKKNQKTNKKNQHGPEQQTSPRKQR